MINPAKFFRMKALWDRFAVNHPKFPRFLQAAAQSSIGEGTVIAEDMELFQELRHFSETE